MAKLQLLSYIRLLWCGAIVRGKPAAWAHHGPRPCQMPPDWSGGYTSLFALQQEEQWAEEQYRRQAR